MASECVDTFMWKSVLLFWCLTSTGVIKTVTGGCGNSSSRYKNEDSKCWYELWYFWFIVVLIFITIVILIIFYCKQQVKRSAGRRGRRRTPVLTMPIAPPQYEVPGHEPPPYHIAMTSSTLTDGANTGAQAGAPSSASSQQVPSLPGYVMDPADYHAYDNLSMTSTISVGAFSNPPPYSSPPPGPAGSQSLSHHQQSDVPL